MTKMQIAKETSTFTTANGHGKYPGCASPQGAGKLNDYFEHEDAPANIKNVFLYQCRLLKNTTLDMITSKLTDLRVLELNAITTPATLAGEANYLSPQLGRLSLLATLGCIRAGLVEGWDAMDKFMGNDNRWNQVPAFLASKWRTFQRIGLMYNNLSSDLPGYENTLGNADAQVFLRVLLVIHATSVADILVGEEDALTYIGVSAGSKVAVGILVSILLLRLGYQMCNLTCRRHKLHKKAINLACAVPFANSNYVTMNDLTGQLLMLPRIFYLLLQRWLGATGPYFVFWLYFKEVAEITLQIIGLADETTSGVTKGFLQVHAITIAINSLTSLILIRPMTARRVQQSLLLDTLCDLIYGTQPLLYVLLFAIPYIFSKDWESKFCSHVSYTNRSNYDYAGSRCSDIQAYALIGFTKTCLFGGDTTGEVLLKLATRLYPLWNAIGRTKYIVVAREVERARSVIQQKASEKKLKMNVDKPAPIVSGN
eukprot:g3237.t1